MSKVKVPFRVIVTDPLPGVSMQVQRGKGELLSPSSASPDAVEFDFEISVDLNGEQPNFLGEYAQGPKGARFVYVNSGTYAGQEDACWSRRAKLSLMSITAEQVKGALADPKRLLEARMRGVGSDGGPTCATVKDLEWKIAKR